jgi:hypothetical protein
MLLKLPNSPKEPSTIASSPFSSQSYVPLAEQTPQTPPFNIIYSVPTISQSYTHVAHMKRKCQYTILTALYLIPLPNISDTACSKIMWMGVKFYLRGHTFPFVRVFSVFYSLCYFMVCLVTTHSVCHTQGFVRPTNNISLSAIN